MKRGGLTPCSFAVIPQCEGLHAAPGLSPSEMRALAAGVKEINCQPGYDLLRNGSVGGKRVASAGRSSRGRTCRVAAKSKRRGRFWVRCFPRNRALERGRIDDQSQCDSRALIDINCRTSMKAMSRCAGTSRSHIEQSDRRASPQGIHGAPAKNSSGLQAKTRGF